MMDFASLFLYRIGNQKCQTVVDVSYARIKR